MNWQDKALAAARGTQTGAIVRAALGKDNTGFPRFGLSATATSDGFLIADFWDRNGDYHMGAFVGSCDDLQQNVAKLAAHCKLTNAERNELESAVNGWIKVDYRSGRH